jgi:hypothetical protein
VEGKDAAVEDGDRHAAAVHAGEGRVVAQVGQAGDVERVHHHAPLERLDQGLCGHGRAKPAAAAAPPHQRGHIAVPSQV